MTETPEGKRNVKSIPEEDRQQGGNGPAQLNLRSRSRKGMGRDSGSRSEWLTLQFPLQQIPLRRSRMRSHLTLRNGVRTRSRRPIIGHLRRTRSADSSAVEARFWRMSGRSGPTTWTNASRSPSEGTPPLESARSRCSSCQNHLVDMGAEFLKLSHRGPVVHRRQGPTSRRE